MTEAKPYRRVLDCWLVFTTLGIAIAWISGRLAPQIVPDTQSYEGYSFDSLDAMSRSARTLGYPIWLAIWSKTIGLWVVPLTQVIVHATATSFFYLEMRDWKMPTVVSIAAAIALGIGCTPMDHVHIISTDALAASFGVMTAVSLMRWVRLGQSARWGRPFGMMAVTIALAVATMFIRPAYLFLIPWIFVAGALLQRSVGISWPRATVTSLSAAVLAFVPMLGWMSVRYVTVGDFAIAPFGHQNLAGILIQLVSDEELNELGDIGRAMVREKASLGERGYEFAKGAPGATMTIDARWDDMTYRVVFPAATSVAGDDLNSSHRAVAEMNRAIITRWPDRYLTWLVKAARRGAWAIAADIVMHPVFLPAIMIALLIVLARAVRGPTVVASATVVEPAAVGVQWSGAVRALTIVGITYMLAKVGFVILTSPPIGRFGDAAAIFMPPLGIAIFLRQGPLAGARTGKGSPTASELP